MLDCLKKFGGCENCEYPDCTAGIVHRSDYEEAGLEPPWECSGESLTAGKVTPSLPKRRYPGGNVLREYRKAHGIMLKQMCEDLDISNCCLNYWENGVTLADWKHIKDVYPDIEVPEMKDVRVIRRQLGMTQAQFAEKLGVSKSEIGRWECGAKCPNFEKIEEVFNEQ